MLPIKLSIELFPLYFSYLYVQIFFFMTSFSLSFKHVPLICFSFIFEIYKKIIIYSSYIEVIIYSSLGLIFHTIVWDSSRSLHIVVVLSYFCYEILDHMHLHNLTFPYDRHLECFQFLIWWIVLLWYFCTYLLRHVC